MMVEAKKLGDDLHDRARTQGVQYCIEKGTKHFAVTDGQRWEIYETHRPVPIDEKRVVELDLKSQSPSDGMPEGASAVEAQRGIRSCGRWRALQSLD